jgi:transcriptional regulator with XRE-family HTH domain
MTKQEILMRQTERREAAVILRERRLAKNLTQQQVADLARVQLRQYQRLESGERSILSASWNISSSILRALDIELDDFFERFPGRTEVSA